MEPAGCRIGRRAGMVVGPGGVYRAVCLHKPRKRQESLEYTAETEKVEHQEHCCQENNGGQNKTKNTNSRRAPTGECFCPGNCHPTSGDDVNPNTQEAQQG